MHPFKFILMVMIAFAPILSFAQQPFDKVSVAINAGNAKAVAEYFDQNVEFTMPDKDGVYSKAQGEQLLKEFFHQNKPANFQVIHNGGSGGNAVYAIGTYKSTGGIEFRTYIYMKKLADKYVIQQIKFTED